MPNEFATKPIACWAIFAGIFCSDARFRIDDVPAYTTCRQWSCFASITVCFPANDAPIRHLLPFTQRHLYIFSCFAFALNAKIFSSRSESIDRGCFLYKQRRAYGRVQLQLEKRFWRRLVCSFVMFPEKSRMYSAPR